MNKSSVTNLITQEIENYKKSTYEMFEGYSFSPYKLIRRIGIYKAQVYPTKTDSQGNYKYWFDIISPRVSSEVKNIDFDTKDIELFSEAEGDDVRILLSNIALKDYLSESGEAEKLNESVEQGSEWGNVVWKKVDKNYNIIDLTNFYVLNPTAKTLADSDVIEYECMVSTDLRKKMDVWDNVEVLLKGGKKENEKTSPEFHIYERNGEITEKSYYQAKGKDGGDENKYILTKVIVGGTEKDKPTEVLFCEEITEKPYKEYHRSPYCGRWLRQGLIEILMDIQTRANEIGNQIARGLEYASKTIFTGDDKIIAQNITTDLQNGDYVKGQNIRQVEVRMNGLDQLIADWNRLMELADKLANAYEVVTGESSPSGTPFRLAAQQNINANKLFNFIREKLTLAFTSVIKDWILPPMLKNLKTKDILRITQKSGMLNRYYEMLIDDWYIKNLLSFPPHDNEVAVDIKMRKLQEVIKKPEAIVTLEKEMWKNFVPRVRVNINGESYALAEELETINSFVQLEQDPVRRTALIEMAMKKKNIDIGALPKTPPQPVQPEPTQSQPNELDNMLKKQMA